MNKSESIPEIHEVVVSQYCDRRCDKQFLSEQARGFK